MPQGVVSSAKDTALMSGKPPESIEQKSETCSYILRASLLLLCGEHAAGNEGQQHGGQCQNVSAAPNCIP